jgi:hypothetical protein
MDKSSDREMAAQSEIQWVDYWVPQLDPQKGV